MLLSYALHNDCHARLKAADEAASPGAGAVPGWLQSLLDALLKALGGGCLPPIAKASDLTAALTADTNGYLESAVFAEMRQNHGRLGARVLARRGMAALRQAGANLTPADDGLAGQLQAVADPNE